LIILQCTQDQYLLQAIEPIYRRINITNLTIDTSDEDRFYPGLSSFVYVPLDPAREIYNNGIQFLYDEDYQQAYDAMIYILSNFFNSSYTRYAHFLLPYITFALNGDLESLWAILDEIEDEFLLRPQMIATINMFDENYIEAFERFQDVIDDPASEIEQLLAELDQSFCYLMLSESGSRSLPTDIANQPKNYDEYFEIQNDIFAKIMNLLENGIEDIVPEILEFSSSNHPNPFNPETTISFTLPNETIASIDIFNIRGQKVRSLMNEFLSSGHHQVIWNGQDDNGRNVSSGVYFYRLNTDNFSHTRRMVLMK